MDNVHTNYLGHSDSAESHQKLLSRVVQMGLGFKRRSKAVGNPEFETIMANLQERCPVHGIEINRLLDMIEEKVLPLSTNFASPYAMAFPDAGNSLAGNCGALLSVFLNQNLINWSPCSPVGTVVEMITLNWLRELVGYSYKSTLQSPMGVGGIVTMGGVSSNTIALLIAREKRSPGSMKEGLSKRPSDSSENCFVIVPEGIDHYCSRLSSGWLGLGEKSVVRAPTKNFRYDLDKLVEIIVACNSPPTMLVCYAGDSRTLTCDNFIRLREICNTYGIWMHVDGCHGTQLIFSSKLRYKISGIELADSITFDPHKTLNLPYNISVVLLKDPDSIKLVQRPEDIITGEEHSFGQITPFFGSKAFLSLKLYMMIKHLGVNEMGRMIETRHDMALKLGDRIKSNPKLLLLNPDIHINSVMFMYCPKSLWKAITTCPESELKRSVERLNRINLSIQKLLCENGIWLHTFSISDSAEVFRRKTTLILQPLRFLSGNPLLTLAHLDEMLQCVVQFGDALNSEEQIGDMISGNHLVLDGTKMLKNSNTTLPYQIIQEIQNIMQRQDIILDKLIKVEGNNYFFQSESGRNFLLKSYNKQDTIFHKESLSSKDELEHFAFPSLVLSGRSHFLHSYAVFEIFSSLSFTIDACDIPLYRRESLVREFFGILASYKSIDTKGFGAIDSVGEFSHFSWVQYLKDVMKKIKESDCGKLNRWAIVATLEQFLHANISYLERVSPKKTPTCLSVENVVFDKKSDSFMLVNFEDCIGADFGYGHALLLWNLRSSSDLHSIALSAVQSHFGKRLPIILFYSALVELHHYISSNKPGVIKMSENDFRQYDTMLKSHLHDKNHNSRNATSESKVMKPNSFRNGTDLKTDGSIYFLPSSVVKERKTVIYGKIRQFCSKEFQSEELFFVTVYGSYSYNMVKPTSDIDVAFFAENVSAERLSRITIFIKQLHLEFGMSTDNEIPYECKLLNSYDFLKRACEGDGIRPVSNGKKDTWFIPQIKKTKECLTSENLLLRFFLGMLTNPNDFVCGDYKIFRNCRTIAGRNLVKAIIAINNLNCSGFTLNELVEWICTNSLGETGDFYLGFSYKEPFVSYLEKDLVGYLEDLGFQRETQDDGQILYPKSPEKSLLQEILHIQK